MKMQIGEKKCSYQAGDLIAVRYGGFGQQLAEVVQDHGGDGSVTVRKWRANSRTWTKNTVQVNRADVLGSATLQGKINIPGLFFKAAAGSVNPRRPDPRGQRKHRAS
jgi:hypothetical protein